MKKKEITLQDLFNKMEELKANFTNRINHLSDCVRSFCENDNITITDKDYVTINADNVYVGGKPATQYHGEDIYRPYLCVAYFKEARDIVREEYGYELLELHCLQSSTKGEYGKTGNPTPDKDGTCSWVRAVYKNKENKTVASLWVFRNVYGSVSNCASDCANYCSYYVQDNASFRAGVFGSVAN